jgi:SAM-dependent methyltransferase
MDAIYGVRTLRNMNEETIRRLNAINREFYRITAAEFDETRGKPWPGWEMLLPHIHHAPNRPLSVLDVGCGNGRFGVFLAQRLAVPIHYHGVDNNVALLALAGEALSAVPGITATLERRDVVESPPDAGSYDVVAVFGLIHHVPGYDGRREFVRSLANRVAPGGILVLACWCFYEFDRFRERITPWPNDLGVEAHDYLLDWRRGETALRYCHYVDDTEHDALVAASGLHEVDRYRADGFTGTVNRYSVLLNHDHAISPRKTLS